MALELALLPPAELRGDWIALVNEYIDPNDVNIVIEDATRRDAAERSARGGATRRRGADLQFVRVS